MMSYSRLIRHSVYIITAFEFTQHPIAHDKPKPTKQSFT